MDGDAPGAAAAAPTESGISRRLLMLKGSSSYRTLGHLTGYVPETVRRYLRTGNCPALFVARMAVVRGVSADWILTGRSGPPSDDGGDAGAGSSRPPPTATVEDGLAGSFIEPLGGTHASSALSG